MTTNSLADFDVEQQNIAHKRGCEMANDDNGPQYFIGYVGKSIEIAIEKIGAGDISGALACLKRADAFRQGWELAG